MPEWITRHKRLVFGSIKLLLAALLIWGMWQTLGQGIVELKKHPLTIDWRWLLPCAIIYLIGEGGQCIFWYMVIKSAGQAATFRRAVWVFYLSQAGKYAPGKALVMVIRAAMLRGPGIEATVVVASCFIEALTTMAVGALLAAVVLANHFRGAAEVSPAGRTLMLVAIGVFLATGIPTIPAIFKQLLRWTGVGKLNPHAAEKIGRIPHRVMIGGSLILAVGWVIQGLSLWAAVRSLGVDIGPLENLAWHTATVSLAVGAGFVSMLPGGLMGREFVHIEMMKMVYPESVALMSAVLLRVVWLIAEVTISLCLYLLGRMSSQSKHPAVAVAESLPPSEIKSQG